MIKMEFIAKSEGNTNIPKLENGVYTAISSMLIDLGGQNHGRIFSVNT